MDARRFNCRKKEYVPGESGELAARSDFAGRTGLQKKSILVVTKDTINEPVILRLLVTIPEAVSVEPEVVFWRPGSKRIILWNPKKMAKKYCPNNVVLGGYDRQPGISFQRA